MNKNYWEKLAPSHSTEIFDVLANDKAKVISKAIRKYSSKSHTAIDLGCAVGNWLPLLAGLFKRVKAVDISKKYIEIASNRHRNLKNVEYIRADISNPKNRFPPGHFALCVNAMMMPSAAARATFLKALNGCLVKGGKLVLVVPSLESALLSEFMIAEINRKNKIRKAVSNHRNARDKFHNLKQGIVDLDHVPYKHYLREELEFLLKQAGFTIVQVEKVEYGWETEMDDPPSWLSKPYPWDWMLVARKK